MATQIIRAEEQKRIFGGGNDILEAGCYEHDWQYTGKEKEGWWFFFWTRHEKEQVCTQCHRTRWVYED